MSRLIRYTAISTGVLLVVFVAAGAVWLLALGHRSDHQNEQIVRSISEKLAPFLVTAPQLLWGTDLRSHGFPQSDFDSPYQSYAAPTTVAMFDSLAAVVFRNSRYEGEQLVMDGNVVILSLATGSVVTTAKWPGDWKGKKMLAPYWRKLIGVGPYVYCCTTDGQFYAYSDGYLIVSDAKVIGKGEVSPVAPSRQKTTVALGTHGGPSSVEITHQDGSKSSFQTPCAYVHNSFVSRDVLVVIGCGALSVIGTDGRLIFSDAFPDADPKFGGASKNGERFIVSVAVWHAGDPTYLTDEWLVVYDIDQHGPVFAVKSDPLPYLQSQSALSADGKRLLTGSGGHLKLLNLPN